MACVIAQLEYSKRFTRQKNLSNSSFASSAPRPSLSLSFTEQMKAHTIPYCIRTRTYTFVDTCELQNACALLGLELNSNAAAIQP